MRNDSIRVRARAAAEGFFSPETGAAARSAAHKAAALTRRGYTEARAVQELRRAGMIGVSPNDAAAEFKAISAYGQVGAPLVIAAHKHGHRTGLIDELGSLTFAEMNQRAEALAAVLSHRGISDADCVGVLCRNHRGFIDITFAAAKLGARILYLNTDFSEPQLRDICQREAVTVLVYDEEFEGLVGDLDVPNGKVLAWLDHPHEDRETLEDLIRAGAGLPALGPPPRHARVVLLTSGTTGDPKGAECCTSRSIAPIGQMLSKVPYHAAESTYIAPPLFHAVGYSQTLLSLSLGCTLIIERSFDPERVLGAVTAHHPTALVVAPVMLRRLLGVLEQSLNRYDLSSLRIVFVSGATPEPELVRRAQVSLGPVLYNFYGSTEVAYVSFATPEDLSAAPGCAGRPPFGTVVRLYDEQDKLVRGADRVGRIFVGNSFQFEGYTCGRSNETISGLMSTGDVGHFDDAGRLWVDGRDDDMIVSGGENLFPGEIEELLATHPSIEEASAIGVDDAEFGARLAVFVVPRDDRRLSADQVRDFIKANLARFKVPRDVFFLQELPRNPAGKVLKRQLRELHRQLTPS